jgi:hypothetical protein
MEPGQNYFLIVLCYASFRTGISAFANQGNIGDDKKPGN